MQALSMTTNIWTEKRQVFLFNDVVICEDHVPSMVDERNMSTEPSWNDSDRENPNNSENYLR
jgi:hypothetical protein